MAKCKTGQVWNQKTKSCVNKKKELTPAQKRREQRINLGTKEEAEKKGNPWVTIEEYEKTVGQSDRTKLEMARKRKHEYLLKKKKKLTKSQRENQTLTGWRK
jgi:hypothetical protein